MAVGKNLWRTGAEHRKQEKQKEAAESELLKKVPKLNTYLVLHKRQRLWNSQKKHRG